MKLKILFSWILFSLVVSLQGQQIFINEVVSSNNSFKDVTQGTPDWLELYNPTDQAIDLTGYYLSDDTTDLQKWSFKHGQIESDSFVVVFASGDNIDSLENTTFTTIEDIRTTGWDYADIDDENYPGTSEVRYTLFEDKAFGLIDAKPVVAAEIYMGNYPEGIDYSFAGVHIKFDTWDAIVDRSSYETLRVQMKLDEGKRAVFIFSQQGLPDWENHTYEVTGTGESIWYDIPITGNVGNLDLSVLSGLTISGPNDQIDEAFQFEIYSVEFSTSLKERFHTNFKLSSSGESVYLSNPEAEIVDRVSVPALVEDFSYGRQTDGGLDFVFFDTPTPDYSNGGETINGVCDSEILFSLESGFYTGNQNLILSGTSGIRYTTDGSLPISTSSLYEEPIILDDNIVVRAGCFTNGQIPKEVFTNTYFINYDTKLPVWSISTHPDNFFDEETGIYVKGPEGNWEEESPHRGANFWQDWEKPVHVEFFEDNGDQAFELDAGIKIFGNFSRANPKKSMSLHFRGEYGASKLEYPLYPDFPGLTSFDELILRGSGGDEAFLHFRDGFHAVLAGDLDFEKQKYRPTVLFINGEYWGIHNIREKSNEDYFKENKNIDKEDIDMIVGWFVKQEGKTSQEFIDFHSQVKNDVLDYNEINEVIDINSFIDYYAYQIYLANYDWPGNNCKYWRQSSTNGKWRWFLYDTDYSTAIYGDPKTQVNYNSFYKAVHWEDFVEFGWPSTENSTLLFSKLLEMPEFKNKFVNRYSDLMNTLFLSDNVEDLMQTTVLDKIDEEVPLNRERWNLNQEDWFIYLDEYKEFWNTRAPYARANMSTEIDLDVEVDVTINISPSGAGYVKLNSIEVEDENWSGIYFKGIPVALEAIPNPGYTFDGWESSVLSLENTELFVISSIDITEDNIFTANFTGSAVEQLLTISEINYNSSIDFNTQDWLEVHNYGEESIDLSGWTIKDDKLYNQYTFPQGTILEADAYKVIAENIQDFILLQDIVPEGPLGFSLSNSGESLFLYDDRGELYQKVAYSDGSPWDSSADGEGYTLQLLESGTDVNDPYNWAARCVGGSPTLPHTKICPLGIDDNIEENNYSLSPNPAKNYIQIDESLDVVSLEIYNLRGEVVKVSKDENRVDVSVFVTGIYFVSVITNNNEKVNFKFIKQ